MSGVYDINLENTEGWEPDGFIFAASREKLTLVAYLSDERWLYRQHAVDAARAEGLSSWVTARLFWYRANSERAHINAPGFNGITYHDAPDLCLKARRA